MSGFALQNPVPSSDGGMWSDFEREWRLFGHVERSLINDLVSEGHHDQR